MIKKQIKATQIDLTDAIRDYVEKKLEGLEKLMKDGVEVLAEIEVGKTTHHHHKGDVFRAEINLSFGENHFRAEVIENDLYKAIDKMKDAIIREVKNSRKRKLDLVKRGHQKIKDIMKGFRDRF